MTEPQSINTYQGKISKGQGPTGPKTHEGKERCRLKRRFHSSTNAYRHGLTGQLNIQSPEEQQAYDHHSLITVAGLAPSGDFERALAQSVADDLWRLNRARTIESGMFALGTRYSDDDTGSSQVDEAFAQTHTWAHESRNLQRLTIYEHRIQRSIDKNLARLDALRTRREQAAREDMRQAKLLYQLAQAEGRPYQPEAYFSTAPVARESVFSTPQVARECNLEKRLDDAKIYNHSGKLPEKEVAHGACASWREPVEVESTNDPEDRSAVLKTVPATGQDWLPKAS